jgi:hypothetical protein
MGRINHGIRLSLWKKRRRRYMRRHQRAWNSAGTYKYLPIMGGALIVKHRRDIDVDAGTKKMPAHAAWDETTDHHSLLGTPSAWLKVVTHDGRHKTPHVHAVPPINVSSHGHVEHPKFALLGFHVRAVKSATHQPGRGGAFRRGCWGAFIHWKLSGHLWPSWDPKHRTPVDPDT